MKDLTYKELALA
ncbi:hypothetical protein PENPOL_c007G01716 [Penicillium polonicum]|uniref:Uncharacterized protein n=1 Tax=Penicillium polonicum TaxID=60169 RepID=A0A1V6NJF2_PENPO|nr:hypothetical protein PENPOL_c007G01716 [Penicillium polonicum]